MKVTTISIDLAKNVFQLMGFTEANKSVFNKRLNRTQLKHFMQMQPPVSCCDGGLLLFSLLGAVI